MPRKKEEQRSVVRKKTRTKLAFETMASTGTFNAAKCTAIDISDGGMKLKAGQLLEKGSIVKLSIPVADPKVTLPIFAEVIWSKNEPDSKDSISVGLRFLG